MEHVASVVLDRMASTDLIDLDLDREDTIDSYLEVVACPSPTTEKQSI